MSTQLQFLQSKIGAIADGKLGKETFRKFCTYYKVTPLHAVHFFAQTHHESGGFAIFTENLNYSATGLMKVFPRYFTPQTAMQYARQPEKIANRVYANRMGNGNEASGQGYLFRGRGALQLTGKDNYQAFAKFLDKPEIMDDPTLVANEYAFDSAVFFFTKNKLWAICNDITTATITELTKRINGGKNGLEERIKLTKMYYNMLF